MRGDRYPLFFVLLAGLTAPALMAVPTAQEDADTKALLELLNTPLSIASKSKQSSEDAPSIVSVVTRRDIEVFGARDLADVLQLIPGFQFTLDISGTVGLGFRGINVHEGKALLMIDGMGINDLGFGNFNFFGSVPATMVERVEVIRGPGSALYGQFAEAAVVNVITRRAGDEEGGRFTVSGSTLGGGATGYGGGLDASGRMGSANVAISAGYVNGPSSRSLYRDDFGGSLPLDASNANRIWNHVFLEAKVGGLGLSYLHFKNNRMGQDGFDAIQPPVNGNNLENNYNELETLRATWQIAVTPALQFEPLVEFTEGSPINTAVYPSALRGLRAGTGANLSRTKAELAGTWTTPWGSTLAFGLGGVRNAAKDINSDGTPGLFGPGDLNNRVYFQQKETDRYYFAQFSHTFAFGLGVTVGDRQELTDFGNASAPRVGLTWVDGAFNAKLLYGQAFRVPLLWQAYRYHNPASLEPEKSKSWEGELGYRFAPTVILKANFFHTKIQDPLVYNSNSNNYANYGNLTTSGAEVSLQARFTEWGIIANIATFKPGGESSQDFLNEDKSQFLGFAGLTAGFGGYFKVGPFTLAPTLNYLGSRSAQSAGSAIAQLAAADNNFPHNTVSESAEWVGNLTVSLPNLDLGKQSDLRLGFHNLGAARYVVIQPYYGAHAPYPVNDRSITLELSIHL